MSRRRLRRRRSAMFESNYCRIEILSLSDHLFSFWMFESNYCRIEMKRQARIGRAVERFESNYCRIEMQARPPGCLYNQWFESNYCRIEIGKPTEIRSPFLGLNRTIVGLKYDVFGHAGSVVVRLNRTIVGLKSIN